MVQQELKNRDKQPRRSRSIFANKLICECCGSFYGRKVWHSNTRHRKTIWFCNKKYANETVCKTPNITEEDIKNAFVSVFNELIQNKAEYIDKITTRLNSLLDYATIDEAIAQKEKQLDLKYAELRKLVEDNATRVQSQEEYSDKFNELESECRKLESEIANLSAQKLSLKAQRSNILDFLKTLKSRDILIETFDEDLWNSVIENVKVGINGALYFNFKDKTAIGFKTIKID